MTTTIFPRRSQFYSSLTGKTITQEEWNVGKSIYDAFSCGSLYEYMMLYLAADTYCLAESKPVKLYD